MGNTEGNAPGSGLLLEQVPELRDSLLKEIDIANTKGIQGKVDGYYNAATRNMQHAFSQFSPKKSLNSIEAKLINKDLLDLADIYANDSVTAMLGSASDPA